MQADDLVIIDAEYRVLGESRGRSAWRRLRPGVAWLLRWSVWFAVMVPLTIATKPLIAGLKALIDRLLFGS